MKFKSILRKLHLWLGLTSGLIIFIVALTGSIFVFNQEFTNAFRSEWINTENQGNPISFHQAWSNAQDAIGKEKHILRGINYSDPTKSHLFLAFEEDEDAWSYFTHVKYYYQIYVDPYTGEVLQVYDEKMDFFQIVKMLHWSLLLKDEIGQPIVGVATLIFVFLILSGLIIWWPKKRKAFKKKLIFNWSAKTKWKKKNFDLHGILAVYASVFGIILAITGLVWAFKWVQILVYVVFSLSVTPPDRAAVPSEVPTSEVDNAVHVYDIVMNQLEERYPDANGYQIAPPSTEDGTGSISVYVQQYEGVYYVNQELQFDQYTGDLLKVHEHKDKNFGERVVTANYDIHVGAILGIPGKIIAFLVSLMIAALPVTGFTIWYTRDFKRMKSKRH